MPGPLSMTADPRQSTPFPGVGFRVVTCDDQTKFLTVMCLACERDISGVCLGRMLLTPNGVLPDVYHPVACPHCGALLMPLPKASPIITARGPLS